MLVGGLAVAAWGEARSTLDVDVCVWAEAERLASAVDCLCTRLQPRTTKPRSFVEETRVLPLQTAAGIRLDVVFGILPFQREAISRAVGRSIAGANNSRGFGRGPSPDEARFRAPEGYG